MLLSQKLSQLMLLVQLKLHKTAMCRVPFFIENQKIFFFHFVILSEFW